jgi:hypothetical protein
MGTKTAHFRTSRRILDGTPDPVVPRHQIAGRTHGGARCTSGALKGLNAPNGERMGTDRSLRWHTRHVQRRPYARQTSSDAESVLPLSPSPHLVFSVGGFDPFWTDGVGAGHARAMTKHSSGKQACALRLSSFGPDMPWVCQFTPCAVFMGPNGPRAGWRLLIFFAILIPMGYGASRIRLLME